MIDRLIAEIYHIAPEKKEEFLQHAAELSADSILSMAEALERLLALLSGEGEGFAAYAELYALCSPKAMRDEREGWREAAAVFAQRARAKNGAWRMRMQLHKAHEAARRKRVKRIWGGTSI